MKGINEEISRIKNLIGVEGDKVLSEQWSLFKYLDDFVRAGDNTIDNFIDDMVKKGKIDPDDALDFKSYIKNNASDITSWAKMADTKDVFLRQLRDKSRLYNRVFSRMSPSDIARLENDTLSKVFDRGDEFKESLERYRDHTLGTYQDKFLNNEIIDGVDPIKTFFKDEISNLYPDEPSMVSFLVRKLESDPEYRKFVAKYAKEGKIQNAPDWVNTIPLGKDIKNFKSEMPKLWAKFYDTNLELILRNWSESLKVLKNLVSPQSLDSAVQKFDNNLKLSLDELLGSDKSNTDKLLSLKQNLKDSFLEIGRSLDVNYKVMWDNMRETVESQYEGKNQKLIKEFFDNLERENNGNYGIAMDEVFKLQSSSGDPTLVGKIKNSISENVSDTTKQAIMSGSGKKTILSFLQNLLSYFGTGLWKTPQQLKRFLIGKGYRSKKSIQSWIRRFIFVNIIVPIVGSAIEWVTVSQLKIWEKEEKTEYTDIGSKGYTDYLKEWLVGGVNGAVMGDGFWSTVATWFPGMFDNLIIGAIQTGLKGEDIDATSEEKKLTDIAIEKGEKVKNKIKISVKRLEDMDTEGSKNAFLGIEYEPGLPLNKKQLLQSLIGGDDDGNMWVIDPKDNNIKYALGDNPNYNGQVGQSSTIWKDGADLRTLDELADVIGKKIKETKTINNTNTIMEDNKGTKFGEDNFKHWKDTFTFKSEDQNNPGQYKEVKISMEDVMDRIDHYRKKYDEDDSFVRAVLDTHEDVVKVMFTKGLADIHENGTPRGLALVLRSINEGRGEMEIFSVARPANGNWFLVKGDYNVKQLANMDLNKKEPEIKEKEVITKSEDDLKKKEESSINILKNNEKEGIIDLPVKVKEKIKEKMGNGWTTETPPPFFKTYYTVSDVNSIFNDKITIYKLNGSNEFFDDLVKYSAKIDVKRGFCRSLLNSKKDSNLSERQKMTVNHIINKCNSKFDNKLGLRNFQDIKSND